MGLTRRKAIVAMINGSLFIDPSDATKEVMEKLQKQYDENVKIVVAPIQTWMPAIGTKTLMEEAVKCLNSPNKSIIEEPKINNRHARRAMDAKLRRKR